MTTLSQLIDQVIQEVKRPDLRSDAVHYANQTIRELHFAPVDSTAILYRGNRREDQITVTTENKLNWTIPDVAVWQTLESARFDAVFDENDRPIWPNERNPGRVLRDQSYFYYRASDYFVFSGCGGIGSTISISYFEFPRSLKYVENPALRDATYDSEVGWSYLAGITTDEQKAAARARTSNWLLLSWHTVLVEGIKAKLYKRAADQDRGRLSYSMYTSLRNGLFTSESVRVGGW